MGVPPGSREFSEALFTILEVGRGDMLRPLPQLPLFSYFTILLVLLRILAEHKTLSSFSQEAMAYALERCFTGGYRRAHRDIERFWLVIYTYETHEKFMLERESLVGYWAGVCVFINLAISGNDAFKSLISCFLLSTPGNRCTVFLLFSSKVLDGPDKAIYNAMFVPTEPGRARIRQLFPQANGVASAPQFFTLSLSHTQAST